MDLSSIVTVLDVGEEALHFLMARRCWHVRKLRTIYVLNVGQLPY